MERRYLVAALAIIATFAVFSRGFHALQRMSFDSSDQHEAAAAARCWANSAAQTAAKVRAHFHRDYSPEQAQMVAEMNMPAMESTITEQMARQDQALARCTRERALQQAERARRDAMKMEREYARIYAIPRPAPAAYAVSFPPDLGGRIQKSFAQTQKQLEMAQEQLSTIQIPAVDVETNVDPQVSTTVVPDVKCKVKISKQAMRNAMRGFQYGFTPR